MIRVRFRRLLYVIRDTYSRPTGHDPSQCPTCLVRDQERYKRDRFVRIHDRASARLWWG